MTRRRYSDTEKADAVGRAAIIGPVRAARELSIPARNVSAWMADPRFAAVREASHEQILGTLRSAAAAGVDELLRVIRDPKAADRDKVRAAEVALDRYQLMSGGATERTENLNVEVDGGPITSRDIREELRTWMDVIANASDEEIAAHEDRAERFLTITSNVVTMPGDDDTVTSVLTIDQKRALRERLLKAVMGEDA